MFSLETLVSITIGVVFNFLPSESIVCSSSGQWDDCYYNTKGGIGAGTTFTLPADNGPCLDPYFNITTQRIRLQFGISQSQTMAIILEYTTDTGASEQDAYYISLTQSDSNYAGCPNSNYCQWDDVTIVSEYLYSNVDSSLNNFTSLGVEIISADSSSTEYTTLGTWEYRLYCYDTIQVEYTTQAPTNRPSQTPSSMPSNRPSTSPSQIPSNVPSKTPSSLPSQSPTPGPTKMPLIPGSPTEIPSPSPSDVPTDQPSSGPTSEPTIPTFMPSIEPSGVPTDSPSRNPTFMPIINPSGEPTIRPSYEPTNKPSDSPTVFVEIDTTQDQLIVDKGGNGNSDELTIIILVIVFLVVILCFIIGGLIFCVKYHKKQAVLLQSISDMHYKQKLMEKSRVKTASIGSASPTLTAQNQNTNHNADSYVAPAMRLSIVPGAIQEKKKQKFRGSVANVMARNKQLDKLGVPGLSDNNGKYGSRLSVANSGPGKAGRLSLANEGGAGAGAGAGAAPMAFSLNFGQQGDGQFGFVGGGNKEKNYYEGFTSYTGDMALNTTGLTMIDTGEGGTSNGEDVEQARKDKMEKDQVKFAQMLGDARVAEELVFDELVDEIDEGGGGKNANNIEEENEDPAEAAGHVTKPINLDESDDETNDNNDNNINDSNNVDELELAIEDVAIDSNKSKPNSNSGYGAQVTMGGDLNDADDDVDDNDDDILDDGMITIGGDYDI